MQERSDIELVTGIQKHDEQALELLYAKYTKKLYKYFYYRVYDKTMCEDLLSQTRFHALQKIHTFDADTSTNVAGRLYTIAHHKLVDYFRKQRLEYQGDADDAIFGYDTRLLEKIHAKHLVEKIMVTLEAIHPNAKEVVLMKLREGLSHKEISTALHITESNSRKIFSRSLAHLQQTYGDTIVIVLLSLLSY